MNNDRRKTIATAIELLEQAQSLLEPIQEEENDAFEALSENLQASEKGEAIGTAASNLQDAIDSIESALSSLEEARQ